MRKKSLICNTDPCAKSSIYLQTGLHGAMVHGTLLKKVTLVGFFNHFSALIVAFDC